LGRFIAPCLQADASRYCHHMAKYFYITVNEVPSGLYQSQVVEVVQFLRSRFELDLTLLAFVPIRGYFDHRKKIKSTHPEALVIPAVPSWRLLRLNTLWMWLIFLRYRPHGFITRNAFAHSMALAVKKLAKRVKIVYDGRGLMKQISVDYDIYPVWFQPEVGLYEKQALLYSDLVMCITSGMIDVWEQDYAISLPNHVVIPCTVSSNFQHELAVSERSNQDQIWIAYVGSIAAWQSIGLLVNAVRKRMMSQENVCFRFIGSPHSAVEELLLEFGQDRVRIGRVSHEEVFQELASADYGILLREATRMNRITSPTKIGEYLCAGLKLIVNDSMAITDLVRNEDLGLVITDDIPSLKPVDAAEKLRVSKLGLAYFDKGSQRNLKQYQRVVETLTQS
jgi:glycosyltransferase involved in cell wall biosynthesis